MDAPVPYPPLELANRVGSLEGAQDPYAYYDDLGLSAKADILRALPADWSFEGKSVLDFGCGAGRTLRHLLPQAETADFWGCDIDAESIDWLDSYLCPPLQVFRNDANPPLPLPDQSLDLIWAVSVFTHLVESWSDWLVELHRVLRPGGLLVATFMGEGMSKLIADEDWDETRIGMNAIRYGQSWDLGGPMVLHSPWWIREHWGRGFEVIDIVPSGFATDRFATDSEVGQGIAVLRRRAGDVTSDELERVEPGDERETAALLHNVSQLRAEVAELRRSAGHEHAQAAAERIRAEELESTKQTIIESTSWRITAPMRRVAELVRALRARRLARAGTRTAARRPLP